jgi:hypothetical protein
MVFLSQSIKPKINTDFPEDIFPVDQDKLALYQYKLAQGKKLSKEKTIAFCGICRNVGDVLERNLLRLKRIGGGFKDYKMFFYENDSSDNTLDILNKYVSDKVAFLSELRHDKNYRADLDNGVDPWHYKRCQILADCRNKYLSWFRNQSGCDLLCVVDLDLKGGWSYDGVNHGIYTLFHNPQTACVSSYGVLTEKTNTQPLESISPSQYIMYDSFAFRPVGIESLHLIRTPAYNQLVVRRGMDPMKVWSNFGGMAIYKTETLEGVSYGAKEWYEGCVDPDHVVFHRQLRDKKLTTVLDPSMIASYSPHRYCS